MNYAKIIGLLAIAASALMAFNGTASATMTEAPGDPVDIGDATHASSEGAISFTGTITITCQKSTVSGEVTKNEANSDEIALTSLTYEECGNHTVTVKKAGTHTTHRWLCGCTRTTSHGTEVTMLLHSFLLGTVHCIYATNGTDMGEVTAGSPAKIDTSSVSIPRTATDGACGEHTTLEGTYKITTPSELLFD